MLSQLAYKQHKRLVTKFVSQLRNSFRENFLPKLLIQWFTYFLNSVWLSLSLPVLNQILRFALFRADLMRHFQMTQVLVFAYWCYELQPHLRHPSPLSHIP